MDIIQWGTQYNFALMHQLSASVTATAITTGAVFPNLTQHYFEITGGYNNGLTMIRNTAYAPLVKVEEIAQWEEYSVLNQGWLAESDVLREVHPDHIKPLNGTIEDLTQNRRLQSASASVGISDRIFHWENGIKVPEEARGPAGSAATWRAVIPPDRYTPHR